MKSTVIQKTKYIIAKTWVGLLLPQGVHQLLRPSHKPSPPARTQNNLKNHPAEFKICRSADSKLRP